MIFIYNLLSLQ